MPKRIHSQLKGNRYYYEYSCMECDWTYYSYTVSGNVTTYERRHEDAGRHACARHIEKTDHSVRVARWGVLEPITSEPSGLRGYLAGIYDGPGGVTV